MNHNGRVLIRGAGTIFRNGVLFRNPVLVGALGLYPVAAAGFGLKNAAVLSILFVFIALPSQVLLCLTGMLVPRWARPAAALLVTAAFYIPAARAVDWLMPGYLENLGMAAALMACNSIIYSRTEEYAPEHILLAVSADALGCSLGFAGVICLISAVRELWLTGGVWDSGAVGDGIGTGLNLPFAGLILAGLLAALIQWVNIRYADRYAQEV
ncbi:MAG TPA: Rnf-Nqr domain containing protein [Caproicibacter sp.]|nr:Rnf-Nqr domain containing protein [Caproicibacter sp.]